MIISISWEKYISDINILVEKIDKSCIDVILGISRGGNIPATIIAERLDKPLSIISTKSYNNKKQEDLHIAEGISNLDVFRESEKILLVDDLFDTGKTFMEVGIYLSFNFILRLKTAVLYTKRDSKLITYSIEKYPEDCWIKFPYEREKK